MGLCDGIGSGKNKEIALKGKGHLLGVINVAKSKEPDVSIWFQYTIYKILGPTLFAHGYWPQSMKI